VAVPIDEYNKYGATGYVTSLVTGVPVAILRPMIGVSDGVTKTLMGVQKWVDPSQQKEAETKYKKRDTASQSHDAESNEEHNTDNGPTKNSSKEKGRENSSESDDDLDEAEEGHF